MAACMMKSAASTMTVRPQRAVVSVRASLRPAVKPAAKVAAPKANSMMVWQPNNNKFFETFSFLPPLTDDQIAKQVDYIVNNGWVPCLEFASADMAYVGSDSATRLSNGAAATYYDNRYWTMWKLPMFGCKDAVQVLKEVVACNRAFPNVYVRLIAFDSLRQVQILSFLVQRPKNATDFQPANRRSV